MALELYQEIIPFTNEKMPYPVSSGNSYSNPVVMPLSFDVTSVYNTVESVIYIRNNDKDKYYKNVAVMLMAPKGEFSENSVSTSTYTIGSVVCPNQNYMIIKDTNVSSRFYLDTRFTSEQAPTLPIQINQSTWFDGNSNAMLPVSSYSGYTMSSLNSPLVKVRMSYGYDEVSELDWDSKASSIIINDIGTNELQDNSYIPIRVRIWLNNETLFTLKKYSLNVCYSNEYSRV
jgi:hypothetical protein